ncbi:MAG: hypothetical protein AAGU17_10775 [Anaerolineaceae bacterium]
MTTPKNNLFNYLVHDYTHYFNPSPGIQAVLEGDLSRLPEEPSHNDWRALALIINGWDFSEKIGLGRLDEYVTKCLTQYFTTGELPKKSIELWICLNMMQRSENLSGYPLDEKEERAALDIYNAFRKNLLAPSGLKELEDSFMQITSQDNYKKDLIHRYWQYQERYFQPWEKYFDKANKDDKRPPVFLENQARRNVIVAPDADPERYERLFKLIDEGEHHKWFRSMNSSQALALSILGNLCVHKHMEMLIDLEDDEGLPLLGKEIQMIDDFKMEHKINYLGERRRTSLDGFIPGDYQVAIECKFTEHEIGPCSKPGLTEKAATYQDDFCDGNYSIQRSRKERCPLTENGAMYWKYIPCFFNWKNDQNNEPCPLHYKYQLVRNILAVGLKQDRTVTKGHAILIYDERNPSCQKYGKIYEAFTGTRKALNDPNLLRKISWQRITKSMRENKILPWLTEGIAIKYGI